MSDEWIMNESINILDNTTSLCFSHTHDTPSPSQHHLYQRNTTMMMTLCILLLALFPTATLGFLPLQRYSSTTTHQHSADLQIRPTKSWGVTNGRGVSSTLMFAKPVAGNRSKSTQLCAVNIIIAGAPASGKGTQCEIIKEKFGVVHLSTGDMLRAAVAAGTEVGKQAKDYMDSGRLVPDEVIIGIVKDRLEEEDCKTKGWLLDGFPRTQAQAKALEEAGVSADCFLFLDVPDEVLVERVVGRRTDPVTGKIYHMTFSPPENDEVLQRLEQRSDDTEEKVKVRLEQFHTNVDAVKDSYTDIMVTIDGNQAPSDVSNMIMESIQKMTAA
jgi:adenylate kinase